MKKSETGKNPAKRRFLTPLLIFTAGLVALMLFAQLAVDQIRSVIPSYEYGIANVITYAGVILLSVAWTSWLFLFSGMGFWKSKALPIGLVVLTCATLYCYRPVNDGALGISRFKCIFAKVKYDPMEITGEAIAVEQSKSTDFWQFLGANRDGVVENVTLRSNWSDNPPEVVWKKRIGKGWSGFAAVGDHAFTLEQRNEREIVTCRKISSGDIIWAHEHEQRHEAPMGGVGPRSTPTVYAGKVFANGGTGMLMCIDAETGKLIWQQDVPKLVGIEMTEKTNIQGVTYQIENSTLMWGRSCSPLIYKDTVIVPAGGPQNGKQVTLIAFAVTDGTEKWRGGDLSIGYGSPSLVKLCDTEQVLLTTEAQVASFDPANGKLLWSVERGGHSNGDAQSSQPVVIDSQTLLLTKGYGLGGELIKLEKTDNQWTTQSLWKNRRVLQTKFTNAIKNGKYVYAISDRVLECVDIGTGKRIWRNLRVGHGQMLLVGQHLIVQTERGDIVLVDAKPEWLEERGRLKRVLRGRCWNTMCVQNGYLLVRSEDQAACIKLPVVSDNPDPSND